MNTWHRTRIKWLSTEVRNSVEPSAVGADEVFHYSIPSLDACGDGTLEDVGHIGSNKLLLRGGEVLISKLNPRISRVLTASAHDVPTLASTEFVALAPGPEIDSRFLCYRLQSETTRQFLDGATMSVTRSQQRIRPEVLTGMSVDIPPLVEQQRIADHLDRETARIDVLLAAKRRMRDLLQERLQVVVSDATHARSAVDLSYALPYDWMRVALRRCLARADYGIGDSAQAQGEYAVLSMTNVNAGEVVGAPGGFVSAVDESLLLRPGDLLFNRTNSRELVGKVGLVRAIAMPTTFASYLVRLRVNERAIPTYLNYLLNAREILGLARSMALPSIGQANLNPSRYSAIALPMPPLALQRQIVADLDEQSAHVHKMDYAIECQISLLAARRQSLITGAVDTPVAA